MGASPGAGLVSVCSDVALHDMARLETCANRTSRSQLTLPPPQGWAGPLPCLFFPKPFSLGHPPVWSVCPWVWQPQGLLGPLLLHPVTTLLLCVSPSGFSFTSLWV